MAYDYEKSIWGDGMATLNWGDPTAFRLKISLESLPENGKILEIGCGAGQFIRAIKKNRPNLDCYGFDISQKAIEKAKMYNDGVVYSSKLEVHNFQFDSVLIYDVLEHVKNPGDLIKTVQRILVPGGKFYLFVPCERDWTSLWNLLDKVGWKNDLTNKYAGHINFFNRRDILKLTDKYNFKIVSKKYSEHFFGQIVGVVAFFLMDKCAKKNKIMQINNESYFKNIKAGWFKHIINTLIYLESVMFSFIPSPNFHIICKKQ